MGSFQGKPRVRGMVPFLLAGAFSVVAGQAFADPVEDKTTSPEAAERPTFVLKAIDVVPVQLPKLEDVRRSEFEQFIVRLDGAIDADMATELNAKLLYLDSHNPEKKDITLIIQSPGGLVSAGFSIFDTLKSLKSDVRTVCSGQCASMAAFILTAGGTPGKRLATPNASLLYHQPSAGCSGKVTDVDLCSDDLAKTKKQMLDILVTYTGLPREQLRTVMERDWRITATDAKAYGLIDTIEAPIKAPPLRVTPHRIPQDVVDRMTGRAP